MTVRYPKEHLYRPGSVTRPILSQLTLLTRIPSSTRSDLKKLEAAAHRCHRAALKDTDEQASVALPGATVGCQAFTRDGGGVIVDESIPLERAELFNAEPARHTAALLPVK